MWVLHPTVILDFPTVSLDFPHSWYINDIPITAFYDLCRSTVLYDLCRSTILYDLCCSTVLYEREQPLWYGSHSIRDYAQFRRYLVLLVPASDGIDDRLRLSTPH